MYGRRALCKRRSRSGSGGGFYTSENAGMSSENNVRIIYGRKTKVSEGRFVRFWLAGS